MERGSKRQSLWPFPNKSFLGGDQYRKSSKEKKADHHPVPRGEGESGKGKGAKASNFRGKRRDGGPKKGSVN